MKNKTLLESIKNALTHKKYCILGADRIWRKKKHVIVVIFSSMYTTYVKQSSFEKQTAGWFN